MATVVPITKACPPISQVELSEYCLLRRNRIEAHIELRMARERIAEKLRAGVDIEDGVLFSVLYRIRRRGKSVERLLVGC